MQNEEKVLIPAECLDDFKQSMKIGYYKMMKQRGLINQAQLEILLQMQNQQNELSEKVS